ncbi:hypothetical protein Ahy_B01g051434 isoform C [Arachis hypogaea]|uniref:Uncharacterized protein n=1 Tax=Arachis hypogaea TaxID=3818 RepID=A0A445AM24_ARAHY|nr:hypothetical protein Ahy_B01g051434 isoform C [Arachis hypogaea]
MVEASLFAMVRRIKLQAPGAVSKNRSAIFPWMLSMSSSKEESNLQVNNHNLQQSADTETCHHNSLVG